MIFTEKIEKLLASNHIKEVIDEFLRFLNEVPQSRTDAKSDAGELRGQIIVLSGRFTDLNSKINTNTVSPDGANQERATIIKSFIQILNQLPSSYSELNTYLEEKNEEDEWKDAQGKNTIEAYQVYFNKYPNGKYKADTIKLIGELEEVKLKQDSEIKRLALLEKERRENDKVAEEFAKQQMASSAIHPSVNVVNSSTPAKSKKGLFIGLGVAALVIIVILATIINTPDSDTENTGPVAVNNSDSNAVKAELRLAFESANQALARALSTRNNNELSRSFSGEALKMVDNQVSELLLKSGNMTIEFATSDFNYKSINITDDGNKAELFAEYTQSATFRDPSTSACSQLPPYRTTETAFFTKTENGWIVSSYIDGPESEPEIVACPDGT
ncbi:MAG: hypothetical protein ABIN67_07005 [Ferruginibacter sp.]